MYITTFYSFKGGVGRTMALVNVAVDLALRGRRVLTVDFDIEAPGLDTFPELRPREEVPGLIDFVAHYLKHSHAPNAADFIGECPDIGEDGGRLWIMPSGQKDTYSRNFGMLNWADLYDRHEGYLLFEDLKKQWQQVVQPDYVLIDSRTGHTDTSGICTRQLPDSVVIFFFPNEQNLRGLTEIVSDIRNEADEPRKKRVDLHFVMSNVPDLDDEDHILHEKISAFQRELSFRSEPMVVHRYDSLSLLNQVVFSKDRPRSRLAKEYAEIAREISIRNWRDREGALEYIRGMSHRWRRMEDASPISREQMLRKIEDHHAEDGELLFRLAELREKDHQPEAATSLIVRAIDAGYDNPDAHLKRARIRIDSKDLKGAKQDIWHVMNSDQVTPPMIREAISQLGLLEEIDPDEIARSTAILSLEMNDRFWLATTFNRAISDLKIAVSMWEGIFQIEDLLEGKRDRAKHHLGMSYMGLGRCEEAARLFRQSEDIDDLEIADAFNYGMAIWGSKGVVEKEVFEWVIELTNFEDEAEMTANFCQCMAISHWASGDANRAVEYLEKAQRDIRSSRSGTEFSCWRYLEVSSKLFEEDLQAIRNLVEGDGSQFPEYASRTAQA